MPNTDRLCPICEEGVLSEVRGSTIVEYKGAMRELPALHSVCSACECEQVTTAQSKANKRTMIAFKKEVDGLLTGAQVRRIREVLGLNQRMASKIFGGGPVAFSKYESDDISQSEAMDKLLRCTAEVSGVYEYLSVLAGTEKSQKRVVTTFRDSISEWLTDVTFKTDRSEYIEIESFGQVSNDDEWIPSLQVMQ